MESQRNPGAGRGTYSAAPSNVQAVAAVPRYAVSQDCQPACARNVARMPWVSFDKARKAMDDKFQGRAPGNKPALCTLSDSDHDQPEITMSDTTSPTPEAIRRLGDMIQDIHVAMLTTALPDGTLRSRPMATQTTRFEGDLWFFTRVSSAKVDELERNPHVNVSYISPFGERYVSVSGRVSLVTDRTWIKKLWRPSLKLWFPQGEEDLDLALLRVKVDEAEYWDSNANAMAKIPGFTKSNPGQQKSVS